MSGENVELGFLEEVEKWKVESRMFPSKVGGKPAWLNLENLPTNSNLACNKCKKTMIFLCQLYAPFEDNDENFHRTLFVFLCRNQSCWERNNADVIKVFRSSLKRVNKFYSYEVPEERAEPGFSLTKFVNLCAVCGCAATKKCSKCQSSFYCCKEHQIVDWKEGHKVNCLKNDEVVSNLLFPEFEIITEPEEFDVKEENIDIDEELKKFKQMELEGKAGSMSQLPESQFLSHALSDTDKAFKKFQKRIFTNPDQVIRYKRGGPPLWIAEAPIPEVVPKCEFCQGERQFEYQIMPQMLSFIKEYDIDWGVIAIYTCVNSCTLGTDYKQEFVFKQDL